MASVAVKFMRLMGVVGVERARLRVVAIGEDDVEEVVVEEDVVEDAVVDGGASWDTLTFVTWRSNGSTGPLYDQKNVADAQLVGWGRGWKENIAVDETLGEADKATF